MINHTNYTERRLNDFNGHAQAAARERSRAADGVSFDPQKWLEADAGLLSAVQKAPREFGIEPDEGIELSCAAGSLIALCPGCLHSSSENRGEASRYIVVQSFYHSTEAALMQEKYAQMRYLEGFHQDTHDAVSPPLRQMLRGKALWGKDGANLSALAKL